MKSSAITNNLTLTQTLTYYLPRSYFTHFFAARTLPTRPKTIMLIMDSPYYIAAERQAKASMIELINLLDENVRRLFHE